MAKIKTLLRYVCNDITHYFSHGVIKNNIDMSNINNFTRGHLNKSSYLSRWMDRPKTFNEVPLILKSTINTRYYGDALVLEIERVVYYIQLSAYAPHTNQV